MLADASLTGPLTQAMAKAHIDGTPARFDLNGDRDVELERRAPATYALLQFTSGSSGRPRGVQVTWENLEANVAQMQRWLGMGRDRAWGSWLPLYHDMGLIGALLGPTSLQSDVWLMRPEQFIRKPLRWLELFGRHGVEISVAPNFGYAYADQRIADAELEGMDFSNWQAAIAAAERLDAQVHDTLRQPPGALRVPPQHVRARLRAGRGHARDLRRRARHTRPRRSSRAGRRCARASA